MAKTVLVVDDDPDVFEVLSLRLESFGYQMISASDGEDGLAKAKKLKPDLIFLDYSMPERSGAEVLKSLKADLSEDVRDIPVVMLTSHETYEEECLQNGAAAYLTKPFDLFRLKQVLGQFLSD